MWKIRVPQQCKMEAFEIVSVNLTSLKDDHANKLGSRYDVIMLIMYTSFFSKKAWWWALRVCGALVNSWASGRDARVTPQRSPRCILPVGFAQWLGHAPTKRRNSAVGSHWSHTHYCVCFIGFVKCYISVCEVTITVSAECCAVWFTISFYIQILLWSDSYCRQFFVFK